MKVETYRGISPSVPIIDPTLYEITDASKLQTLATFSSDVTAIMGQGHGNLRVNFSAQFTTIFTYFDSFKAVAPV